MDVLGKVEEITCDGRFIVRCTNTPELGDIVFRKETKFGTIGRIFGPVDEPYVSINPMKGASANKGETLLFNRRKHDGKDKRRNRRNRGLSRVR